MNSNSYCSSSLDRNHNNNSYSSSSSSYCSSSTSSKSNHNIKMSSQEEVPLERKNSIGLMEALLGPPPPPQLQQTTTTTNTSTTIERTVSCKQEEPDFNDTMMTLEDFLAMSEGPVNDEDVKFPPPPFPTDTLLSGSGRMLSFDNPSPDLNVNVDDITARGGKRRPVLDPLQDKAAQQRQRRMIKNRESAARSRERKQAYQAELESLALKLEEENEMLIKAKEEQTRKRYKQLMDNIIPVTEKRRPTRYMLKKVRSMEW